MFIIVGSIVFKIVRCLIISGAISLWLISSLISNTKPTYSKQRWIFSVELILLKLHCTHIHMVRVCELLCVCVGVQKLNGKYHFAVAALQLSISPARQQDVTVATRFWRLRLSGCLPAPPSCRPSRPATPHTVSPPHLLPHAHNTVYWWARTCRCVRECSMAS